MPETITVEIPYTVDSGEKLVNETFGPNNIRRSRTGSDDRKPMTVQNGRLFGDRLSLDEQGFVFVAHPTQVADFFDAEQLKSVYYPEVEQLTRRESGASRVVIFDHTLRSGDETERETKLIREPVLSAHNDYTEWSGPNRVREIFPDEANELLKHRFAIIQVWRAINQPIRANPLALADAKSVAMDDLLVAERRYPHRVGQRSFGVQSLRFGHGWTGALHAAYLFCRSRISSQRPAASKYRSARLRVFRFVRKSLRPCCLPPRLTTRRRASG